MRAAPLDQEHPRHASAEDVGADHPEQRPPLHVRRLNVAGEDDPAARPRQPIAQLDVLDRRPGVEPRVETAEFEEDLAADHPAAGPECVSRPGVAIELALLVHVMVQQVAELAHDARRSRLVVVRAEQRRQPRIGHEPRHPASIVSRVDGHVGVEEEDQVARRPLGAAIAGRRRALRAVVAQHDRACLSARRPESSVEPSSTTINS